MVYRVDITGTALDDAEEQMSFLENQNGGPAAERWLAGLLEALKTLERMPHRCARVPEADYVGKNIRHLLYHSHRIIFRIETKAKVVTILRIYHGSRKRLRLEL